MTSETPTFGRYAEIPYDQMTLEQKDAYDTIIKARGRLPGPVKIWIHNPSGFPQAHMAGIKRKPMFSGLL